MEESSRGSSQWARLISEILKGLSFGKASNKLLQLADQYQAQELRRVVERKEFITYRTYYRWRNGKISKPYTDSYTWLTICAALKKQPEEMMILCEAAGITIDMALAEVEKSNLDLANDLRRCYRLWGVRPQTTAQIEGVATYDVSGIVQCLAWSSDGDLLAAGTSLRRAPLKVWSFSLENPVACIEYPVTPMIGEPAGLVAFVRGDIGATLAVASREAPRLWFWPYKTPSEAKEFVRVNEQHRKARITAMSFSVNGAWLATGDSKGNIYCWRHDTKKAYYLPRSPDITAAATTAIPGYPDATESVVASIEFHSSKLYLAIVINHSFAGGSPQGARTRTAQIVLWDTSQEHVEEWHQIANFFIEDGEIHALAWDPNPDKCQCVAVGSRGMGRIIAVGMKDGTWSVDQWQFSVGEQSTSDGATRVEQARCAAWRRRDPLIAIGCESGSTYIYTVDELKKVKVGTSKSDSASKADSASEPSRTPQGLVIWQAPRWIYTISWNPVDPTILATGGAEKKVRLFRVRRSKN